MNWKNVIFAVLISILSFALLVVSFALIGGQIGLILGFIFPLIAYAMNYKKFKEEFWTSFFISLVIIAILVLGGLKLFVFK